MRIHHIGYLVKRIDDAVTEFEKLGYEIETPVLLDEIRGAFICFMQNGGYRIELISPEGEQSPIYGLLKKSKNSPYHLCYETVDFNNEVSKLEQGCLTMFLPPSPAPMLSNRRVAFLMSAEIGMIEILEAQ